MRHVSVGAFFFLLLSSFFSHPESCLKIEIFVGKSNVLGRARERREDGGVPGEGGKAKQRKTTKKREKTIK